MDIEQALNLYKHDFESNKKTDIVLDLIEKSLTINEYIEFLVKISAYHYYSNIQQNYV